MMKSRSKWLWAALCFALSPLLPGPRPANALICTIDAVPSSTLLLPHFEVDLSNESLINTLFSIDNTTATAVLVHVVIYSDLAVPVLNFDVYLTGYDIQTIDMASVLNGNLPQTASAGQDPHDTISPKGPLSQDINFASCNGVLPPQPLSPAKVAALRNALTGLPAPTLCAGINHGDNIARGYVTVDTVNQCSTLNPGDSGYFAPGFSGVVTYQNNLTGEFYYITKGATGARVAFGGENLVNIEADFTNPATSTAGRYTFYGRYDNWTAVDNREPLATEYAVRFFDRTYFGSGAPVSLIVWRDPKVNQSSFTCPVVAGARPPWYPLGQEGFVAFDEQEHVEFGSGIPFPAASMSLVLGTSALPISFKLGWVYLDLNTTVAAAGPNPPVDPAAAQALVQVIQPGDTGANFQGSAFFDNAHQGIVRRAQQLDSACAANHSVPLAPRR